MTVLSASDCPLTSQDCFDEENLHTVIQIQASLKEGLSGPAVNRILKTKEERFYEEVFQQ